MNGLAKGKIDCPPTLSDPLPKLASQLAGPLLQFAP